MITLFLLLFKATYGTLYHIDAVDNNNGYVAVNPIHLVNQTSGNSYVSQVTFDFYGAPQAGADMWLYVMDRPGNTNVFNPVVNFQIPSWAIRKGPDSAGIQTIFFGPCDLPISAGQYLAYGANSLGGDCYQTNAGNEYYIPISTNAQLAALSNTTYSVAGSQGYAMSFVVSSVANYTSKSFCFVSLMVIKSGIIYLL